MNELWELLKSAGLRPRDGATPEAIARVEAAIGVELPYGFPQLWEFSDGLDGDRMEFLSLSAMEPYAQCFPGGFGYVPFTECNDSNPYVVCCREPLRGFIVHVFHDDEPVLVCRGLQRFLELVAEARRDGTAVYHIGGDLDFDHPDRTEEDAATARELLSALEKMDREDEWRGVALRFAAQLLGPGQEDELARVLALGDEYTREAVLRRWKTLGTPEAQVRLREDAAAYQQFLAVLKQAFEAAGVRTEPDRHGDFRLEPGNVGLNFAGLFADCRRPGAVEEWVRRFAEQLGAK